jgi:uncharacterized protein (DUF2132 family)
VQRETNMELNSRIHNQNAIKLNMDPQRNNPLHGKTLQVILEQLLDAYGWEGLASKVNINCFKNEPSIPSSLKFLRKTPWAREQVEALYLRTEGIS